GEQRDHEQRLPAHRALEGNPVVGRRRGGLAARCGGARAGRRLARRQQRELRGGQEAGDGSHGGKKSVAGRRYFSDGSGTASMSAKIWLSPPIAQTKRYAPVPAPQWIDHAGESTASRSRTTRWRVAWGSPMKWKTTLSPTSK